MQRRIRLVVEERRMALSSPDELDDAGDPDATIEIPRGVVGRVAVESA